MASEKTVNGDFGNHQVYGQAEPFQPAQAPNVSNTPAATSGFGDEVSEAPLEQNSTTTDGSKPPSKDEVGWYFVESYYTTLSKNPETLHLYYNKRSQFVSGVEAEKVEVSVGQQNINKKIKALDFQDCKVRVSNVDAQESFNNIVVQVIGEISNKAATHRKFVQTFILAEQPKGYFVLNDIFRYIVDDEEEEIFRDETPNEEATSNLTDEAEPATLTSSVDQAQQQNDIARVDKKLEEEVLQKPASNDEASTPALAVNGYTAPEASEIHHAEDAPVAAIKVSEEPIPVPEQAARIVVAEEEAGPEKPRDPEPTPVASPPKASKATPIEAATPAAPPKPTAPKTWAKLVATNHAAPPAVPNGTTSQSAATSIPQIKAAPPTTNRSPTPTISTSDETPAKQLQNGGAGWQTAGSDKDKKQGRQHTPSVSGSQDTVLGYVKNVTEKVDASILKSTLLQYGKLVYFDVSRQKNCAFVEFVDSVAYNAAVAANPHSIGGEQIYVEERRPRANAYGGNFAGRGGMRGGRGGNEGRPGSQGRGGYPKDGGRGGYGPRGRGGNIASRGRGQPQTA